MRLFLAACAGIMLIASAGCATDRYPLSGEKCSPCDNTKNICPPECPQVTVG